MVIFLWIVIGSIFVSTAIALLGCKGSKITLSEIADKLERQGASRSDPDEKNFMAMCPDAKRSGLGPPRV
jgi:hypothetical protein